MSTYKNLFDNVTPKTDNEAFMKEIKKGKKPVLRLSPKKIAVGGIAAATAAAVTITGYASGWNLSGIIHSWFGSGEDILSKNISEIKTENVSDSFDALDFEIKGAVNDDNIAVIFMDITRTDGKIFDCEEYHALDVNGEPYRYSDGTPAITVPDMRFNASALEIIPVEPKYDYVDGEVYSVFDSLDEPVYGIKQYVVKDGNPSDNKLTLAICLNKAEISSAAEYLQLELYNFTSEKLRFRNEKNRIIAESYNTESLRGYWSADISLDFAECEKAEITPDDTISLDFYNHAATLDDLEHKMLDFTLTKLSVSPVSVSMSLEAPLYDETMYLFISDIGEVVLKDGSIVKFAENNNMPYFINEDGSALPDDISDIAPYYDRGEKWLFTNTFMLETPVDINEIDYVKIGNKTFSF